MRKFYMMKSSGLRCLLGSVLAVAALLAASAGTAQAQPQTVSGTVTDTSGEVLPGATVVVKGDSTRGAITAADGTYTINIKSPNDVLIFGFLWRKSQEIAVNGRQIVDVQLQEDYVGVDEVIVVGYGTQKRQFLVGSVSQVSSKDLLKVPADNVSNLMTGRLPGITSIQRSGQPGSDQTSLLVRGTSTYRDSSPLTLVDGVERMINTVNPYDIETITVLKDAATSAIYGVRGANGVILITTKRGSQSKATITYSGRATFTQNTAFPELLNASDYIGWHNKAREMDGLNPIWTSDVVQKMKDDNLYGDTDWMGLMLKNFGFEHQHNISAVGGTEKISYFTSIGFLDQNGIIPNTSYKRYNVRSNIDAKIAKNFMLNVSLSGSQEKRHAPGYSLARQSEFNPISAAIYALPIIAPTWTDPDTGLEYSMGYLNGTYTQNPVAAVNKSGYQDQRRWQFEGNAKLEYDFGSIRALQGLKASIFAAYDFSNTGDRSYMNAYEIKSVSSSIDPNNSLITSMVRASGINPLNSFTKSASFGDSFMLRPSLTYSREFGRHTVGALLLYEQRKNHSDTMTGTKNGYYADYPIDLNFGSTWDGISIPVNGSFNNSGVASVAGRFSYAFDSKYLAEFSFREDGSYKFAPENRWSFFPSVAVGWVMSEENFFEAARSKVDFLKFRTSFGELGTDDISPYMDLQSYNTTAPNFNYIIGDTGKTAYYTSNYVYRDLTWSRTRSFNVGFELIMWGGKLGVEFDWFYKLTYDLLENVSGAFAPSLGGNVPTYENSGRMDNRGFELVLKHNNRFASGWQYSLTGSLAWARNKILSRRINDDHPMYRAVLGQPIGAIYGYKAIGLYQTQEQIDNSPTAPSGMKRLGDLMYADINGDGKIESSQDFIKIGRGYTPELNFSLDMNVSYKGIYLSALWQGVALCSYQLSAAYDSGVFDNTMFTRPFYGSGNAPYYLVEGSWREDNRNADYPRLGTVANGNNAWPSTWWVKNGSYLRLKALTIGYDLPANILKNTGIGGVNIFVSGRNLLTFSAFKYVDPEMPSVNNGYYPQQRTYSIGVDLTF